jgi:hypothetical protein
MNNNRAARIVAVQLLKQRRVEPVEHAFEQRHHGTLLHRHATEHCTQADQHRCRGEIAIDQTIYYDDDDTLFNV